MRSFARAGVVLALLAQVFSRSASAQTLSRDEQLLAAVAAGDLAKASALIAQGADVNADNGHGGTPLYTAADLANVLLVKLLLEHGANPSTPDLEYGRTPLKNAIVPWSDVKDNQARAEIVRLLVDKGAGSEGAELVDLMRRGYPEAARTIIERGQATFSSLNMALAEAKRSRKTELAELLAKAGAKEPTPIDAHQSPARVKLVSGVYRNAAGQSVTLVPSVRGDELVLERSDGVRALVVPTDLTTFRSLDMQVVMRLHGRSLPPDEINVRARGKGDVFARVADAPSVAATAAPPTAAPAPASTASARAMTIPRPKAGEWPSFRGVHASGVADGTHPPTEWDVAKGTNIRWKTPIPGFSHSSPIVWGDRVFVTTVEPLNPSTLTFLHGADFQAGSVVAAANDREPHAWRIYALDRKTGKVLWQRTPYEGTPRTARHVMQSHADATPATDGTHLVVSFGSQGLYCYDMSGQVLWKRDLGPLRSVYVVDPTFEWSTSSSPIVYKNLVFLQVDLAKESFLAAFDLRTGKDVWRISRDETPSWATPLLYESPAGDILITAATKFARGYDPMTGRELWRLGNHSTYVTPTPVAAGEVIYFTSGSGGTIQPIYAVRAAARGDITLKDNEVANGSVLWSWNRGGSFIPTPVVYDGILYVSSTNGVLSAYDLQSGKRLYQDRLTRGGSYSASGVAADGRLYFASEDGDVIVVKAGPAFERLAQNTMGEVIMATPALTEGLLIVRTQHNVIAVGDGPPAR